MAIMFKTAREWWLVAICLLLLLTQFFPQALEFFYPIIDWQGGNRLNMQVSKDMREYKSYQCGETVLARIILQKQRMAVGTIQWKLVPSEPGGTAYNYLPRVISDPIGISDQWAKIEELPKVCAQGQYHFEGAMVYPVWFANVTYTLRTTCFLVKERKEK